MEDEHFNFDLLFPQLSVEAASTIMDTAITTHFSYTKHLKCKEDTVLLHEGDVEYVIYRISQGMAYAEYNEINPETNEANLIAVYFPGEYIISYDGILGNSPTPYNVKAVKNTNYHKLTKGDFAFLKSKYPTQANQVKDAVNRLGLHALDMRSNRIQYLLNYKHDGKEHLKALILRKDPILKKSNRVSKILIAKIIGISSQYLSEIIKKLKDEGFIKQDIYWE